MKTRIDLKSREVSFGVPRAVYTLDGVRIAAHIFDSRAGVLLAEGRTAYEVTLRSKRRSETEAGLSELAGEFLNELLNQEVRFLVGRFNQKISNLVVTQALLAARGGDLPREEPAGEKTPEFQAEVAALMREAEEEIRRTMPRKIAPRGAPVPPAEEAHG